MREESEVSSDVESLELNQKQKEELIPLSSDPNEKEDTPEKINYIMYEEGTEEPPLMTSITQI